jgi:hypothetical protein
LIELLKPDEEDEKTAHSEFLMLNLTDWRPGHSTHESIAENEVATFADSRKKHARFRRQVPKQSMLGNQLVKTIETAIFVDSHLKTRFQNRINDLKRLVMATMNEVQLIYNYQSLRIPVRIVISRLEILNRPEDGPNNSGGDIDRYLDNFCSWQAKRHRSMASNNRWDHALMLTGFVP